MWIIVTVQTFLGDCPRCAADLLVRSRFTCNLDCPSKCPSKTRRNARLNAAKHIEIQPRLNNLEVDRQPYKQEVHSSIL